ncbi:MAG TPA: tRNA-binding protein [Vicinamibacteria bacterium]|nr:tRNA-binding protein [Vicinamibacteria bacterium]HXV60144.1 tRNA-binding protein [Vicinamibacteria bacterium]
MKPAPIKSMITVRDLEKVDIRVGTIESVEQIEGADEVMKLSVDFGDQKRQVLAGLKKEREDPSGLVGKQALFVVNLKPRRMRGERSEAMLFDIGYADGIRPRLAVPEEAVPNGARAG